MRFFILLSVVCASVLSEKSNDVESRLILINSGPVRGYKDPHEDVFVFSGIPYATAPTGTQRFKAPLPPPFWFDILEAVDKSTICPQLHTKPSLLDSKEMKEDCLIASIYVPDTEEKNLPVVVYVHGGGFLTGFGDMFTPKKLVSSKKIIAVTFNYRLGAHGFLCLGTEDIPGNAGMKDQVALLRWVKKNIASFGGNPNDVTIAGGSAGSSSVDLLMISKMAKGLFHKVIPESGASTSPYAVQVDPIKNTKEYAKLIDITDVDDIFELENSFKKASYDILQSGNDLFRPDATFLLSPCVERDNGQEIFLDDNPVYILKQGNFPKLPMLYGFSNMEGLLRISLFEIWQKEMNENFEKFLPVDLHFKSKEQKELTANEVKEFYFGDKPVDDSTVIEYVNYISDIVFTCPTLRNIDHLLRSGHDQIYLYQYSYTDENTPFVPKTKVRGANHCSQSVAVLDEFKYLPKGYFETDDNLEMRAIMRELWLNFIINGKPTATGTPAWPPVGKSWSPHMDLKKNPELGDSLLKERCLFWDDIYNQYYNAPMPPSHHILKHSEL